MQTILAPVSPLPELPRVVARTTTAVDELLADSSVPFDDRMTLALARVAVMYADLQRLAAAAVPATTRTVVIDLGARAVSA
ncbi:hypothetical protein [Kineosporia succinea]|uniref:Uncharacterized protein n=1 Tax=Kineosporia succinea TaxID=84632 RepID=A0ABT9P7B1_9ACTN|nr:hypothetical protein [Kineosporia succinea]MDP9828075.1 hypothetical protein [Kineosporia succinea]